jgi:hypothetical protein
MHWNCTVNALENGRIPGGIEGMENTQPASRDRNDTPEVTP